MENLKNLKEWFVALGWSNQAVVVIVFIFLIFGAREIIKRKKSAGGGVATGGGEKIPSAKKIWKWFGIMLSIYGIFLLGSWVYSLTLRFLPTPEEKIFRELSKNLAEVELQPEKEKLANLNAKVKGGASLTEEEKRTAIDATKKIEKVREDYSKGKLVALVVVATAPKPTPTTWDWTFEWEATPEQMRRNENQEKGLINDARVIFRDEKVLKFNYKRPSGKLVELTLSRNDSVKEFYQGKVSQSDLYLRVWLVPDEKGGFRGTSDNGPNTTQMEVFLKRKL